MVILPHDNEESHYYGKRIIAGPGDKVQIENGLLMVNGKTSEFQIKKIDYPGIAENLLTLKNGEYFCIGDNPEDGEDSRQADIGLVGKKDIVGKVWFQLRHGDRKMGFVK